MDNQTYIKLYTDVDNEIRVFFKCFYCGYKSEKYPNIDQWEKETEEEIKQHINLAHKE